jgi:hypothetical protein
MYFEICVGVSGVSVHRSETKEDFLGGLKDSIEDNGPFELLSFVNPEDVEELLFGSNDPSEWGECRLLIKGEVVAPSDIGVE